MVTRLKTESWVVVICRSRLMTRWKIGEKGRVVRVITAPRDVADRKRAEEALRAENACLNDLSERAPQGIGAAGSDRAIVRVSDESGSPCGCSRPEAVSRP